MKTVVSEKGQVTIPKKLRMRLGIKAGQTLELSEKAGYIIVAKTNDADVLDRLYGILPNKMTTDSFINSIRGKPDTL
ncbi:MAG: AbrB/MazE/SpoVT family DNA-binding domain-containing protein [Deltaproteobacteria bacterium]|nr:AbrB/MazE/SpoVT family DNA-binding domain-containing protein [Deltaproteobacteria bacterium]